MIAGQQSSTPFGRASGDRLFATGSAGDILAAGAGDETLVGGASSGNDVFFAGSGNDRITLGSGRDTVFAGSGVSSVTGGAGMDSFAIVNGQAGGMEVIDGFKLGADRISLVAFDPGEAARALASAQTTAAGTTITLSDKTQVTFTGFTGLDSRIFGG